MPSGLGYFMNRSPFNDSPSILSHCSNMQYNELVELVFPVVLFKALHLHSQNNVVKSNSKEFSNVGWRKQQHVSRYFFCVFCCKEGRGLVDACSTKMFLLLKYKLIFYSVFS